mgnify:CR=1 FL=1
MSWEVGVMIPPPSSFTEVDFYMTWRVGLLIPSPNSVMEVDFYRSLPHDTTCSDSFPERCFKFK